MNTERIPVSKINLAGIAPEDRFSIWRETVSVVFESELKPNEQLKPFTANLTTYHLSSVLLNGSSSCSQYFNRDHKLIAKDGVDHCMIQVYLQGSTSGQWAKHNNSTIRAGDIFFLDFTQPIASFAQDFNCLFLIVPRNMLLAKLPQLERFHGKVLPRESITAKILKDHFKTLYALAGTITEEEACSIAQGVINLTASYFNRLPVDEDCPHIQAVTLETIRCYIFKNLGNPDLSPEHIANHFRISRAYLYRLFDSSDGITRFIYEQRLIRAFNCLSNPANYSQKSISQIAYSLGFNSDSHFSRSFRQFFGVSPSEVRNNARLNVQHNFADATMIDRSFEKWVLSLR